MRRNQAGGCPLHWELQDEEKVEASRAEECCLLATQLGRGHRMHIHGDMYTWGCVQLKMCDPWQWLGQDIFCT